MDRISKLNNAQITASDAESWHNDYKDSAFIYAGGLDYDLTEGDVICVFSQYGEIMHINLVRDKKTGKSKGFAFLRYADQRSTILAVDNLNGSMVLDRKLRVDHISEYKQPKKEDENAEDWDQDPRTNMNVAPQPIVQAQTACIKHEEAEEQEDFTRGIDPEDPMYEYLVNERKEEAKKRKEESRSGRSRRSRDDRHSSHRHRGRSPYSNGDRSRIHSKTDKEDRHRRGHKHRPHRDDTPPRDKGR